VDNHQTTASVCTLGPGDLLCSSSSSLCSRLSKQYKQMDNVSPLRRRWTGGAGCVAWIQAIQGWPGSGPGLLVSRVSGTSRRTPSQSEDSVQPWRASTSTNKSVFPAHTQDHWQTLADSDHSTAALLSMAGEQRQPELLQFRTQTSCSKTCGAVQIQEQMR
jgi:hypothetical protein